MNKKIMAVAVAGALAAPGLALAQASVTISGFVKVAVGQISTSNPNSARNTVPGLATSTPLNSSEWRFNDDGPTRITFDMRDQIDSDIAGIARLELRNTTDGNSAVNAGGSGAGFGSSSGNQWIGLESKSMGTVRLGSLDQHYIVGTDSGATYAPTQVASPVMNYVYTGIPTTAISGQGGKVAADFAATGAAGTINAGGAIAGFNPNGITNNALGASQANTQSSLTGASRTRNLIRYDSPNWNGVTVGVGYSFNTASGQEADLATTMRKGNSLVINPVYTASNWRLGWSYLDDKRDASATTAAATGYAGFVANDWKGNRLYGDIKLGDFTIGFNWDKTSIKQNYALVPATGVVVTSSANLSNRTAWSLPVKYQTGKHVVTGLYSKANSDSTINNFATSNGYNVATGDNGAKFWSVSYSYLFSARTSIGVGYAALTNSQFGAYTLAGESNGISSATNVQNGYASANSGAYVGEKQTYLGVSLRQTF